MSKLAATAQFKTIAKPLRFDFPAIIFVAPTFQKQDFNSGLLRVEHGRVLAAYEAKTDTDAPFRLILASTHRDFAEHHFCLPPGHDPNVWQPCFHVSIKQFHTDPERQLAWITPMFVLKQIDLREPKLPDLLAHLMKDRPAPRVDVSIRELIDVWDRALKAENIRGKP
jgi:hypothetical protein